MADKPDPELDELLDSAAKDFKKTDESSSAASGSSAPTFDPSQFLKPDFDPSQFLNPDGSMNHEKWEKWAESQAKLTEDLSKQARADFDGSNLAELLEKNLQEGLAAACEEQGMTPDDITNKLKNLKLFGAGPALDADKDNEFSEAILGAMQSLQENLSEAFPAAEGEDGDGEDSAGNEMENLTHAMTQMMLALLSKEMLLPPFKEMSEKYPGWLEENKSKLSEADLKRYTAQLEVVNELVAALEREGEEDDKSHLDKIVELMGKAQELGQPPQDLAAQLSNALDDSKIDAMLKNSGADQCNIM